MAWSPGRFRLPAYSGLLQVQRVRLTSTNRYVPFSINGSINLSSSRFSTLFFGTSALAVTFLLLVSEQLSVAEIQQMMQKYKKRPDSEYGESWQKERRRLEQLNHKGSGVGSKMGSMQGVDSPHTQQEAVFIPMTWFSKCKREYYSGSDPEWQQFLALSKDRKRSKAVKTSLADTVCEDLGNHAVFSRLVGKPLTVYAKWLDFEFPSAAPVEYERSGILWVDGKIIWATRRIDDRQTKRLYRILFPAALATPLQVTSSTRLATHYGSLKSLWSRLGKSEHQRSGDKMVAESLPPATGQDGAQSASTLSRPSRSQQKVFLGPTPSMQAELVRNLMPEPGPDSAIAVAMKKFKLNFSKRWRESQFEGPRGTCRLRGEIGIEGPKGRFKMFIIAVYHPKEDVFVHISGVPTGIWQRFQAPAGRPKPGNPSKT